MGVSQVMRRFPVTSLLVVLAMLISIAGGPVVVASANACGGAKKVCSTACCCHDMACCAVKGKQPAQEQPAPVQQRVGQDLALTFAATPFSVLYTFAPTEAKRAPRKLLADGHAPDPLAASCIQLI
jgi:hypothetical protein